MSVFSGGNGWRQSTPGQWMLDAARAAEPAGQAFSSAFNAAASRAQNQKQFDSKMSEERRQFDQINPALPTGDGSGAQPAWLRQSNEMMNGPQDAAGPAATGATGAWQQFKFKTPTEAIGAVLGSSSVAEAATIRQANAGWEANPTYRRWMDDAFKAPIARENSVNAAERVKIAAQTAENSSVASKILVKDAADFNRRIGVIDPAARAAIIGSERNQDGTISALQWQALQDAEILERIAKANERAAEEEAAIQRGDAQRTVVSDRGVVKTFAPPTRVPEVAANVEPMTKTLENGVTLAWMPGSKGLHQIKPDGQKMPVTAYQLSQIAKSLGDDDPDKTNFLNMAKSLIKGAAMPTNAPSASPAKTSTNAVPKVSSAVDANEAIRQANEAIAKGKDPAAVRARLKAMGISLKE